MPPGSLAKRRLRLGRRILVAGRLQALQGNSDYHHRHRSFWDSGSGSDQRSGSSRLQAEVGNGGGSDASPTDPKFFGGCSENR